MKEHLKLNLSNFRFSSDKDLILSLIQNELLSIHFLTRLKDVGFDTSLYPIELSSIILVLMGFPKSTDQLYDWYYNISNTYAMKMNPKNHDSITSVASEFYTALQKKCTEEIK